MRDILFGCTAGVILGLAVSLLGCDSSSNLVGDPVSVGKVTSSRFVPVQVGPDLTEIETTKGVFLLIGTAGCVIKGTDCRVQSDDMGRTWFQLGTSKKGWWLVK